LAKLVDVLNALGLHLQLSDGIADSVAVDSQLRHDLGLRDA
jgi:hypothetical protein